MSTLKETILDLFDFDKMEPKQAADLVDRMTKMVLQTTLVRVLPTLSEEDLTEYEKIVKGTDGPDVLFAFFEEKIPNFKGILAEEAEQLRAGLSMDLKDAGY